jgi:hypothetical protein
MIKEFLKEIMLNILQFLGLAWWVEVITETPLCLYYFGPFLSVKEADDMKTGYLEDLKLEGAQGIKVAVKRCKPHNLTVCQEMGETPDRQKEASLSGHAS